MKRGAGYKVPLAESRPGWWTQRTGGGTQQADFLWGAATEKVTHKKVEVPNAPRHRAERAHAEADYDEETARDNYFNPPGRPPFWARGSN